MIKPVAIKHTVTWLKPLFPNEIDHPSPGKLSPAGKQNELYDL
jgi:hypothetical protein